MKTKAQRDTQEVFSFVRNVVPDQLDLRDRPYQPAVAVIPGAELLPRYDLPVLDQGSCNGCTGFALASMVNHLQRKAGRAAKDTAVSPFMLYSMARRYDEFPGNPDVDSGSSLRGAMKGWYKHGACAAKLWQTLPMPATATSAKQDWWLDAIRRPLGAYYRVDTRSVTDMHIALNETGILYASAACHTGWLTGLNAKAPKNGYWSIPAQKATLADGGHAFVIVGYNREGFIIQNSWGTAWGQQGRAILSYEDWLDNAMDCWVAQIGVVTELHETLAQSPSLPMRNGKVQLASDPVLSAFQINPFIIDMENNGQLSNTGQYRTKPADITELVTLHLAQARKNWGIAEDAPVDIAVYAHGGLTSEKDAAETAKVWIPALYEKKIFPIFLMWETGAWETLKNRIEDSLRGQPRPTSGILDKTLTWYDERLERLFVKPGSMMWGEMKQNADALSGVAHSGGQLLYQAFEQAGLHAKSGKVRLHLIGHSAGSIVHSHIIERLAAKGWTFETVNFMAPAVRMDVFEEKALPAIKSETVKRYHQFHLDDHAEQNDHTCAALLGYSRSLLYLVSQSFENGSITPILGMQKYFDRHIAPLNLANVQAWSAPGANTRSTTHGGFDDDEVTRNTVIDLILKP